MRVAATFIADDNGLEIILEPAEVRQDTHSGTYNRVPGTGLTLKFKGGRLLIENKGALKLMMDSSAFKNGQVRANTEEDPTGFWRMAGIVEEKLVPVAVAGDRKLKPGFKDLDWDNIKPSEKEIMPLSRTF